MFNGSQIHEEGTLHSPLPAPKQEASSGQPGLSPTASTVSVLVLGIWVSSLDRVSLGG